MALEMKLKGLMIDPVSEMPIIILSDPEGDQVLPIWVGIFEANAIAMQLEKITPPRPFTHDLLRNAIEELGGTVRQVVVTDLQENTFFARIEVDRGGTSHSIDSRPSDAIALALRTGAPILVEPIVLEKSSTAGDDAVSDEAERLRKWLETVDPEELGRYEM
jgi:bifunctional DNase/RNase